MTQPTAKALERKNRELGRLIESHLDPGLGFAVLTFSFGDGGHMTWISNADRACMIDAVEELLGRLKRDSN